MDSSNSVLFCSLHMEIWLWLRLWLLFIYLLLLCYCSMFIIQNDIWIYDYRSHWCKFIHFVNLLCVWFIILYTVRLHWLSHKLRRTCLAKIYAIRRSILHIEHFHFEILSKMKRRHKATPLMQFQFQLERNTFILCSSV